MNICMDEHNELHVLTMTSLRKHAFSHFGELCEDTIVYFLFLPQGSLFREPQNISEK